MRYLYGGIYYDILYSRSNEFYRQSKISKA